MITEKMSVDDCVEEARNRLKVAMPELPGFYQECEVFSWPQTWSNTACGFGGIGGCAITKAQCVVVVGPEKDACVYHGGMFAYYIEDPNGKFWDDIANVRRHFPGAAENWQKFKENTNV